MQTFTYQARDTLGKMIEGTLDVESRDEAVLRLKKDGLTVVELEEDAGRVDLLPRRIKLHDIIFVTSQLAVMVDTGINVSTALGSIAEQESNPALKTVLLELRSRVESGEDLSSSLARHPKQFDKTYVALIRAAEQTGKLGEMLEIVANYLRSQLETRQKVRAAMAYPSIMAVLAVGVTIFLLTYILPKFEPLFTKKGVKLPTPTIVMMTASDIMIDYWPLWVVPYRVPKQYAWISDAHGARMNDDLFIDCAIYGMKNDTPGIDYSELLERRTYELDGIKTLISRNHYSRERFWQIYAKDRYDAIKTRTDPHNLFRDLYDKFHYAER